MWTSVSINNLQTMPHVKTFSYVLSFCLNVLTFSELKTKDQLQSFLDVQSFCEKTQRVPFLRSVLRFVVSLCWGPNSFT